MFIFKPAWMSDNASKALDVVKKLKNQKTLIKVATEAPYADVRITALSMIGDQETIENFALHDSREDVRMAALQRLINQGVIEQVALSDNESKIREEAVRRVNSQEHLKQIALCDKDEAVRRAAIEGMKDETMLAEVAKSGYGKGADKVEAAEKLTDTTLIQAVIAQQDTALEIRMLLLKKAEYGDFRTRYYRLIAQDAEGRHYPLNMRAEAAREIHDFNLASSLRQKYEDSQQPVYAKMLMSRFVCPQTTREYFSNKDLYQAEANRRCKIARKLTNEKWLAEVCDYMIDHARDEYEKSVFNAVKAQVKDTETMARLIIAVDADNEANYCRETVSSVEWSMLSKIENPAILKDIAAKAKNWLIRYRACKLAGGHFFDGDAINKCKCTICEFEHHVESVNTAGDWKCEKCGGVVKTNPFVAGMPSATIYYNDGTDSWFRGYDGFIGNEHEYVRGFNLE